MEGRGLHLALPRTEFISLPCKDCARGAVGLGLWFAVSCRLPYVKLWGKEEACCCWGWAALATCLGISRRAGSTTHAFSLLSGMRARFLRACAGHREGRESLNRSPLRQSRPASVSSPPDLHARRDLWWHCGARQAKEALPLCLSSQLQLANLMVSLPFWGMNGASQVPFPLHSRDVSLQRWKKGWFVLYPASPHGVARLEFFDGKEGAAAADRVGTKRLDKKIVRLADCVCVAPVPDCSLKEGLAAFRLETSERTYLFAAEPPETAEWMAKLCEAAFLGNPGKGAPLASEPGGQRALEMATNSIYYSRDEASEFWVTVQKTEAAERCKLQGAYVLKASRDGLVLQDSHSRQPLYTWPYRLLRRYGRDKVMFSFEAGRRCESGPGNFTFETKQGNEIFRVVEAAIQEQKAQVEENRQSSSSLDSESSGVAHLQSAVANVLLLESEGPLERRGPRTALGATLSVAVEEKDGAASPLKGQSLRDPLLQGPRTPPWSPLSGLAGPLLPSEDTANVYSEPLDAVKGPQPKPDPLYADPLDSRHGGGTELGRTSLLYEQVGLAPGSSCPSQRGAGGHIYDEPEGRAPRPAPAPAPIYDEAHLPREAWRTQGLEHRAGYEVPYRPGTGDYAVPAFHQKPGLKPSKPSPAPKPPRMHKKPPPAKNGSSNNNNNNHHPAEEEGEPLYSRVLKPPKAGPGSVGREQSVDGSRPASVYEDLGEI